MDSPLVDFLVKRYSKEHPSNMIFIPEKLPRDIFFNGEKWTIREWKGLLKKDYFLVTANGHKVFLKKENEFSFSSYEVSEGKFEKIGLSPHTRFYDFVMLQKAEEFLRAYGIEYSKHINVVNLSWKERRDYFKGIRAQKIIRDYRQKLGKEISL